MTGEPQRSAATDPGFFEGRLLIDILAWDWNLRVAISPAMSRPRSWLWDGLEYSRDFTIQGRIRAPSELRGKCIKVTLSPFGPKVRFGRGGMQQVGQMIVRAPEATDTELDATLMLPEAAIPTTATSLASIWKHLDIWTFERDPKSAKISAYAFSAEIHANLQAWANAE